MPTLTYGLELCTVTESLLDNLNVKSRKGLKSLFNISSYSRNYLHNLLRIEHVSTSIINNKLQFFTRLLSNPKTADILLSMFQFAKYECFTTDISKIAQKLDINLYDVIVSRKCEKVRSIYDNIQPVVKNELIYCLSNWNISQERRQFFAIMEEFVPRN